MEVQVDHAAVVAANRATPARLLNENPFDLLQASCDRLAGAPLAAPAISALALTQQMELNEPVAPTDAQLSGAVFGRGTPALLQERYGRLRSHEQMFALT